MENTILKNNLQKAVTKLKQELSTCVDSCWYGVIRIYENSSVKCYIDAPGMHMPEPVFKYGSTEESKLIFTERLYKQQYGKKYKRKEIVEHLILRCEAWNYLKK